MEASNFYHILVFGPRIFSRREGLLYIYQDLHNPNHYNHLPVETAGWFKSMWLYPDPETLNPPASLEEVKARVEKILIDGGCKVLSEDLEVYM